MSAVLVPLAGLAVLSLVQPAIIGRYLAFALPLVAVFGAIGLDDAFRTVRPTARVARAALWVGTAVVVAGSLAGVAWWHRGGDIQDFEEAADLVFDQAQPGDSHPVRLGRRPSVLRARGRRPHRREPRHPPLPDGGLGHVRHR